MSKEIHAIKREDGFRYREFSDGSDHYVTPPLSEEEMTLFLLGDFALNSCRSLGLKVQEIPDMLKRARETGTSSSGDSRSLNQWDDFPQDYWGTRFPEERTTEAFLSDVEDRLNTPLRKIIKDSIEYAKDMELGMGADSGRVNTLNTLASYL
jgi:hypothetical protein